MVFRRRYQVVMVGDSPLTAAQRSVLSEHRTEEEARTAAAAERRRLEVVRADDARAWRLQVLRDGEIVHEERPRPEEVPSRLERPRDRAGEVLSEGPPEPAGGAEAGKGAVDGSGATAVEPETEAPPDADGREDAADPAAEPEPPPEGPVPDWVIRRFEEAVERERRRGGRGEGTDGT